MLKLQTKRLDAAEILCLEGQIVTGQTEILRGAVQSASGASDIILDFSNVRIVDAHGLGVLLQLREQALAKGAHFELINVSKPLYRIFEITRLDTVFEINRSAEYYRQAAPQVAYAQRLLVAA
jgi:anti-sigma B factor antagonist